MPCCSMWLLVFFCMSPVGSIPISLNLTTSETATTTAVYQQTTTGITGVSAAPLIDAPNATSPAADYVASLNHTLNATSLFDDYVASLNHTLNAASLAADYAVILNHTLNSTGLADDYAATLNRTLSATSLAADYTITLNRTLNATSLAADYATLNSIHNATSSAPVDTAPLNDAPNATSLAADYTITLNRTLNATSLAADYTITLNATSHNVTGSASGAAALQLDSSGNEGAETMNELNQDMPVKEGDILIPENRNAVQALWPDATVPYTITDELAYREAEIKAAIKMISDVTCIRFKKRDNELNYVKFVGGKGCASFVGCQGGAQPLFVAPVCNVGNLCHEIIHALGLHHEHTREDRDKYVTINWPNILPGKEENFKVKYGNTQSLPYDPDSIMHYGQGFFSANGNPTMLPKGSSVTIGQRTHLSQLDIQRLKKLYSCA